MFIVQSTFEIPSEDKVEEVINIYLNRSRLVDQEPGFLDFSLLQNAKRSTSLTLKMTWKSREDYINWVTSDSFKKIHELEKKYPDQQLANVVPKVEQFTVVAK